MSNVRTVVIVEDNAEIRQPLAALFGLHGYEVVEASDGEDALNKLLSTANPGLILLDLMMPGMDGWTFLQVKENESRLAQIPVLVLSAVVHFLPAQECASLVGAIQKPVVLDDLLAIVESYCGRPRNGRSYLH